jgi:hypothetical protein
MMVSIRDMILLLYIVAIIAQTNCRSISTFKLSSLVYFFPNNTLCSIADTQARSLYPHHSIARLALYFFSLLFKIICYTYLHPFLRNTICVLLSRQPSVLRLLPPFYHQVPALVALLLFNLASRASSCQCNWQATYSRI